MFLCVHFFIFLIIILTISFGFIKSPHILSHNMIRVIQGRGLEKKEKEEREKGEKEKKIKYREKKLGRL